MATPTVLFAPQALDIVQTAARRRPAQTHDDAVGGLLIGKRQGDALVVLAASEPGPNADDRRLGVALDVTYINAVLEAWFARDPDADIVGLWHTHPRGLDELTLDDVAAAYTLREDTGRDIVFALTSDEVRCFYLDAASTQGVGLEAVPYRVGGDAPIVTPVLPPRTAGGEATTAAPTTAKVDDVPPTTTPATSATGTNGANDWTTNETDLQLPPARDAETPPPAADPSNQRMLMWAIYAAIALLVLIVLWWFFGGGNDAPSGMASTAVAGGAALVASATAEPTAASAPTVAPTAASAPTVAPTSTEAATPTEPATPTITTIVEPVLTTGASTAPPADATADAGATSTTTAEAAVTSVASSLPYGLAWRKMSAEEQTAFLARAQSIDCADCYNVDLVGPEPYRDLRVRINDGSDETALRTFDRPALAYVSPRAAPHTLQLYDPRDRSVIASLIVLVQPDQYYVLRVQPSLIP